jgi:IS5 family transposase
MRFRRRAAIDPVIGHVKHDQRMARNFLKGLLGDAIDLFMVAAFNTRSSGSSTGSRTSDPAP